MTCGKRRKHIQKVKTEKKISCPDARKIVLETSSWLLPGATPLFASVAAKQMVSCAVQTDITWVKSENPVRPKTLPPKGMQTGTQTSTPQQTPTKASQARPGRSSANKNSVEIVDGVAVLKGCWNWKACMTKYRSSSRVVIRVLLPECILETFPVVWYRFHIREMTLWLTFKACATCR